MVRFIAIGGGLSSIVCFIIIFFSDKNKVIIALIAFIIFLLFLVSAICYAVHKIVRKEHDKEFLKLSDFITYKYLDRNHVVYDVYRLIQSKRAFLREIKWNFKWTGGHKPKIKSDLQLCDGTIYKGSDNGFDHVVLKPKKALFYNESEVLHFHAEMDDSDNTSLPVVGMKIEEPVKVVNFQVILSYKSSEYCEPAEFKRKPILDNGYDTFEHIAMVNFDKESKSYQHILTNPEVGYSYRLEWKK